MTLKEKLIDDMKRAQKSRDALALSVYRMVRASIKNREIDSGEELDDDAVLKVIVSAIKQRRDSREQFNNAGRTDLAEKEEKEIEILIGYMPEQVGEEVIEKRCGEVISELGASSLKDMGAVMKVIMAEFKGKADGSVINRTVKKMLS